MRRFKILILLLPGIYACSILLAQDARPIWRTLSADAYEAHVLYIKLTPQALQFLPGGDIPLSGEGFSTLPELQNIWQQYGFASFKKLVDVPLRPSKSGLSPVENDVLRWVSIRLVHAKALLPAIEALNACKPWVEMAEPVYKVELYDDKPFFEAQWIPNDSLFSRQWHYHNTGQTGGTPDADIDLPEAWEIEKGHPSVMVAVMDQGIDTQHVDLLQNISPLRGQNFFQPGSGLMPGNHGNHTAGTIGAVNNNVSWVSGIAGGDGTAGSGVRLLSCQIFGVPSGSGGIENALVWSAQNGAAISSNSWGYVQPDVFNQSVLDAIDFFIKHGGGDVLHNGLVVFSGGNSGDFARRWPGTYHKVMGVTATNHHDLRSWYSTYHERLDIAAPGGETSQGGSVIDGGRQGVLSTIVQASGSVGYLQGTSMAAPHVSGVAALVASHGRGRLSADDVKSILLTQADPIDHLQDAFYRGKMGEGRLNALKALERTRQLMQGPAIAAPTTFTANASCGQIVLAWTKAAPTDKVMVAISTNVDRGGLFGIPQGVYEAGDSLTGGGKVIYSGTANGYTYTQGKVGDIYYFKIWTEGADGVYSYGVVPDDAVTVVSQVVGIESKVNCFASVDLSWTFDENCADARVLLAYNTKNEFVMPAGNYQAGDMLGTATILFSGAGNSYRHILPPGVDTVSYFYSIWSRPSNGAYEPPMMVEARTPAAINMGFATNITSNSLTAGWQRDTCFNGDVLLVWNTSGAFPDPPAGIEAGETFPDGETRVLYRGPATSFLHQGLMPNTQYHYAVWPVMPTGYGYTRTFSARTRCSNEVIGLPYRDTIGPGSLAGCLLDTVGFRNFTAGPW
ncbi:MAG TPA: S8 family serine peptidase, partial [Phnomibacter sp.]|nr:S8 family serine peptidase [Phnomibacter sp.]